MAQHSAIVGGSTAGRLLNCPGSWQATLALPPTADIPSEYAEEGTAMHAAMAALMFARKVAADRGDHRAIEAEHVDQLIGETFHDRVVTREHVDTMLQPAIDALFKLEAIHRGGFDVLAIEHRVKFPRVPGAFGTVDLILGNETHVLHVDWKFGQGVGVRAVYGDSEGAVVNPQLMFYVCAAVRAHNKVAGQSLRGRKQVGAIIQPRGLEPLTYTEIIPKELRWFEEDMQRAVEIALGRDPPRVRGEHCRFAPCKVTCPLWTGPLLDLSALEPMVAAAPPRDGIMSSRDMVTPYGEYLARAKVLLDGAAMLKKEVDEQIHAYLEQGGKVPGWRLKAKTKQRQWVDEETVSSTLLNMGFSQDEIWQRKLQTFAATDAAARRHGVKIPDALRVAPPTTETTIAATDDPAPVVEPTVAVEQFTAALKQLQTGT